jgi:hypothetical protein
MTRLVGLIGVALCAACFPTVAGGEDVLQLPENAFKRKLAYRQAVEIALRPLRIRYLADLERLRDQAVKENRLDEARAVSREIEFFQAAVDGFAGERYVGRWHGFRQDGSALFNVTLVESDGTAKHGTNTGRWVVNAGDFTIHWADGNKTHWQIDQVGDAIRAKTVTPKGEVNGTEFRRVP